VVNCVTSTSMAVGLVMADCSKYGGLYADRIEQMLDSRQLESEVDVSWPV